MKKILIIEDNPEISENLRFILETKKYKVLTCKKGNIGLVLAAINQPELIISSMDLPDTDGFSLIRKIKELQILQKIPFVFITESIEQNNFCNGDSPSVDGFINNPLSQKEVLEVVGKLIGESIPCDFSVLIISPDILFIDETDTFFRNNNYKVMTCSDLTVGHELYKRTKPDIIISEMIFPDSDDPSMMDMKKIIANDNAPVILIGSGSEMKDFRIALNSGAADYFSKPVNYFSLLTSCELRILKKNETRKKELQPAEHSQLYLKNEDIFKKILLVEDNPGLAESISIELEMLGYLVITANNGQEGIDLAYEILPDLVVCDIMMPKKDGYYVLNSLRENVKTSYIPFVFLTAKSGYDDLRNGMNLGADDYLTKPIKLSELDEIIRRKLKIPERNISSKKTKELLPVLKETNLNTTEVDVNDFIPNSTETKEVKKRFPTKANKPSPCTNEAVEVLTEESVCADNIKFPHIESAELDIFLSKKNEARDYEDLIYQNVTVIKVNLNRAVEKEVRDFYKYLFTIIENGAKKILIDVRHVEYFSSSFLGVLISALKRVTFLGGDIRLLMDLTHRSLDMIFLEGILRVFQIYENHHIALNAMLYPDKNNN